MDAFDFWQLSPRDSCFMLLLRGVGALTERPNRCTNSQNTFRERTASRRGDVGIAPYDRERIA